MKFRLVRALIRIVLLILPLSVFVGAGSWKMLYDTETENSVGLSDDYVNVNLHAREQSNSSEVITKFYIPNKTTVTHDISAVNENGESVTTKYTNNIGSDYKDVNYDEIPQYYDVVDGVYTPIDQHNSGKGPEQIKSLDINVDSWTEVSDSSQWGDVWVVGYDADHPLRFYVNCDNNRTGSAKYKVGDVYTNNSIPSEKLVSETVDVDEETGNITTTRIYERVIVNNVHECVRGEKKIAFIFTMKYIYWSIFPTYQRRMVQTIQKASEKSDFDLNASYSVKNGAVISPESLTRDGYSFCAFYSDETYSQLFDFTQPITQDTDIYALFLNNTNTELSLSNKINESSELDVYDQRRNGSGGDYDVIADPFYDTTTNTIFLKGCSINANSIINFTFDDSKIYLEPIEGTFNDSVASHRTNTDTSVSTEYSGTSYIGDDNCSLNIVMTGDITIEGTLNLGADIGGTNDYTKFSYIKGRYAKIDLYGHNIYVDGGTLNGYGVITDTVGTGKIIVTNGGTVKSTISVTDGRQINQVLVGISKRQTPFSEYKFPYLQVPVYFYNGTTFSGYLKFELCRYGISNIILNVISSSNALFLWNDDNSSNYVLFYPYRVKNITDLNDINLLRQDYDLRNAFIFNANIKEIESLNLSLQIEIMIKLTGELDFIRIDVPISSFFDIIVKPNYTFEIISKLTFYPGSALTIEKGAILKLSYRGEVKYSDQAVYISGEERYVAGGLMSYTNHIGEIAKNNFSKNYFNIGIYNNSKFWQVYKNSNINIYGDLEFDNSIDTSASTNDGFYYLSGNINLSEEALKSIIENKNIIKTYDFKAELHSGYFVDSAHLSIDYEYEAATAYNCNCLISNNTAYIIDGQRSWVGSFDPQNGVFIKTGDISLSNDGFSVSNANGKYFLQLDNDMYEDGSSSSNQASRIDRNINIAEISELNINSLIIKSTDNTYYAYFCGIYVPVVSSLTSINDITNGSTITANCRKFFSNSGADYSYAANYDNMIIKINTSTKIWSYSSFA